MILIGGRPDVAPMSPGPHHGGHGRRMPGLTPPLPALLPGAWSPRERIPLPKRGLKGARKHPSSR
eukprot:14210403-Heterocapsa_arctica.AAC.1